MIRALSGATIIFPQLLIHIPNLLGNLLPHVLLRVFRGALTHRLEKFHVFQQ